MVPEARGQCVVSLNHHVTQGGQGSSVQPEFEAELCGSPRHPRQVLNVTGPQLPYLLSGCCSRVRLVAHPETGWSGHMIRARRLSAACQPGRVDQNAQHLGESTGSWGSLRPSQ